jgi:hypothetical protein
MSGRETIASVISDDAAAPIAGKATSKTGFPPFWDTPLPPSVARDPSVNQSSKSSTSENAHAALSHSSLISSFMETMREKTNGGNSSLRDLDNLFHLHWKSPFVVSDKNSTDLTVSKSVSDAPNSLIVWKHNPIHRTLQVMIKTRTRLQSVVRRGAKYFLSLLRLHGWTNIIALSNGYHDTVPYGI